MRIESNRFKHNGKILFDVKPLVDNWYQVEFGDYDFLIYYDENITPLWCRMVTDGDCIYIFDALVIYSIDELEIYINKNVSIKNRNWGIDLPILKIEEGTTKQPISIENVPEQL